MAHLSPPARSPSSVRMAVLPSSPRQFSVRLGRGRRSVILALIPPRLQNVTTRITSSSRHVCALAQLSVCLGAGEEL